MTTLEMLIDEMMGKAAAHQLKVDRFRADLGDDPFAAIEFGDSAILDIVRLKVTQDAIKYLQTTGMTATGLNDILLNLLKIEACGLSSARPQSAIHNVLKVNRLQATAEILPYLTVAMRNEAQRGDHA